MLVRTFLTSDASLLVLDRLLCSRTTLSGDGLENFGVRLCQTVKTDVDAPDLNRERLPRGKAF